MYVWSALAAGAGLAFTYLDSQDVVFLGAPFDGAAYDAVDYVPLTCWASGPSGAVAVLTFHSGAVAPPPLTDSSTGSSSRTAG